MMTRYTLFLALLLLSVRLRAEDLSATATASGSSSSEAAAAPASSPSAASGDDFQPSDVYYAPQAESSSSSPEEALQASYYSTARIQAVELGSPKKSIEGVDLFIDGQFVGKSPLDLSGYLVNKKKVSLSAHLEGYGDATRPNLELPAEGEEEIVMANDHAPDWYTLPSFAVGLLMEGGGAAAYAENTSSSANLGLGLICGGVAVVLVSQVIAHWIQIPAMHQAAQALNAKADPLP